ncbi:DUF4394 domain-containing protein [Hyphococcus sp.]|uniref:DUF4394 domain-containing protein n=1 Tax=Hyphococcus sp. TaxID=2038636 RepID=UPI003CCC2BB3
MKLKYIAATAAAALTAAGAAHADHMGLTLGSGGTTLVGFDITNASTLGVVDISGDAARLDAIDFRPATGELIGYSSSADEYYLVDPVSGATTLLSTAPVVPTNGPNVGLDFNPTIDRSRTVGANDENVVFNPNDGSTSVQTDLFYAMGDPNEGTNPTITANAYSNSVAGAMTTQQYALDSSLNILATLNNNAGDLTTIGGVTLNGQDFNFNTDTGFDIFSGGGSDVAYAILQENGGLSSLFTIDLASGALNFLGSFANNLGQINGLAVGVVPGFGEVPIPAALPLFLAGMAGLRFASRRKKKQTA